MSQIRRVTKHDKILPKNKNKKELDELAHKVLLNPFANLSIIFCGLGFFFFRKSNFAPILILL